MRYLPFLIALVLSVPVQAEDLLDVYRQALAHDPIWGAAQANYRAGAESAILGRSGLLPRVDLTVNASENNQELKTPTIDSSFQFSSESYTLELTQALYNPQRRAVHSQGQAATEQAEQDLMAARHDLIQRVAQAYLTVLAAKDVKEYAELEKNAVQGLLKLAQRNFNVGIASLVDVHDAQAAYDLATAQAIAASNELSIRHEALRLLIGDTIYQLAELKGTFDLAAPDPKDMERWVETAIAENPQIKSLQQAVTVATEEVERNRGARSPTIDLIASRNYSDVGRNFLGIPSETTTDQIGLKLKIPLYQGGALQSNVRTAAARLDETTQRLESAKRRVAQQARETYLAVINGIAQVRALEQARASNQRALESTVLGSERGLRTGLDVLNNQRTLFRTLRDLSRARYDYLLSHLRLRAAAGILNEQDLEHINRLLAK